MQIKSYQPEQFETVVNFIATHNAQPEHHIGYFGTHPADIRIEINDFFTGQEQNLLLAWDDATLVGLLGIESDEELGRSWLYGPIVVQPDPVSLEDELYRQIQPLIPAAIQELELFCDVANQQCHDFAQRHAFPEHSKAVILNLQREQLAQLPSVQLPDFDPRFSEQLNTIHDELFPRSYASAQSMIHQQDDQHKLIMVANADQLLGYAFAKVEPSSGFGYIEFVGVASQAQRQGIGKQLMLAILHWMFSFPEIERTDLTMNQTNQAALALYSSLGFSSERTMQAYSKVVDSKP